MTDAFDLKTAAALGADAAQLLESRIFTDVWKALEDKYAAVWLSSRLEDQAHREHIFRLRLNMAALRSEIDGLVNAGKAASAELAMQERAAKVRLVNRIPA